MWSHVGNPMDLCKLASGELPWTVDDPSATWWNPVVHRSLGCLESIPAQIMSGPILGHNSILFFQVMLAAYAAFGFARALGEVGLWLPCCWGMHHLSRNPQWNRRGLLDWIGALVGWAAARGVCGGAMVGLAGLAALPLMRFRGTGHHCVVQAH